MKPAGNGVRRRDVEAAFGISRSTLQRGVNRCREGGGAAFCAEPRRRGPSVMTEEVRKRADRLLAQGLSGAETARRLGLKAVTVNKCRREGLIGAGRSDAGKEETRESAARGGPEAGEGMTGRGERDSRGRAAPMGRGARDCAGRVAASAGDRPELSRISRNRFRRSPAAASSPRCPRFCMRVC